MSACLLSNSPNFYQTYSGPRSEQALSQMGKICLVAGACALALVAGAGAGSQVSLWTSTATHGPTMTAQAPVVGLQNARRAGVFA